MKVFEFVFDGILFVGAIEEDSLSSTQSTATYYAAFLYLPFVTAIDCIWNLSGLALLYPWVSFTILICSGSFSEVLLIISAYSNFRADLPS